MTADPIELGSILFTLVEPHKGHEVAYNRWYERDHFYAGCMIGAWTFAGQRWVATRACKDLRWPDGRNPITPDAMTGSYLALYWILAGHHGEWTRWGTDQVNRLHADGRMFAERDHIHTLLYRYQWAAAATDDGVPPELALDHRYPGLAVLVAEANEDVDRDRLAGWYRDEWLPPRLRDSSLDQVLAFTPLPLLADAPGDVPRVDPDDRKVLLLCFLDSDPSEGWDAAFAGHPDDVAASGLGTAQWQSPFIPTVPGTDTYTDQLW
jgi:hypothetical protein